MDNALMLGLPVEISGLYDDRLNGPCFLFLMKEVGLNLMISEAGQALVCWAAAAEKSDAHPNYAPAAKAAQGHLCYLWQVRDAAKSGTLSAGNG